MDALRVGEVKIQGKISEQFLLEGCVECVDARVGVIAAEHAHPREARKGISASSSSTCAGGWRHQPGPGRTNKGIREKATGDRLLLYAIGGDRSYLREHVLPAVIDSITGAEDRFSVAADVPGKTHARLKLLLWAMQRSIGWKSRIIQKHSISSRGRRDCRFGKDLGFPAQA